MVKKKIDTRIRTLIENGLKTNQRTMFLLVGDNGKDQVVNLHYILSKSTVKARPSVLWCYKHDLGFTSHRKKRIKQIKKQIERGIKDADEDDPFERFISSTTIRYTYYRDSHKILGNTFGMCVLQDFEALTPNLLARTIETVEGGGLIIFLLKNLKSLKQLYSLTMDVHSRFRTDANQNVVGRFNERFILSLGECGNCLVLDDELNVLPISSHLKTVAPVQKDEINKSISTELKELKESLKDTQPVGSIISEAKTLDQAKAVLTFVDAISEKTLRSTVTLSAARGRGKSAALGLSIAAAVAFGYSNIFVTAPSPENLKTLFEFIFKGFDALNYKEHMDYEFIESTNPEFNKAIVRVNIFHSHRQTIQYILPTDHQKLAQAELLVIDEAAAIPLPLVKSMLGSYLVFMASTINGYEGTGRSLSLKLINQLRQQSGTTGSRILREIELKEPIRYAPGDSIENWLNSLLCLDASVLPRVATSYPHPSQCELYYVNRDTLFSYHKASETFLQRLVALFVSSHYKNSPDDLLLMSDAPAHHLFILLGPVEEDKKKIPDILCAVQVCLEGKISKQIVFNTLSRGSGASGDLIPWTISQQFQDSDFATLSGARVVRIATSPEYQKMGYGTRALELLSQYFQGEIRSLKETDDKMKQEEEEEEDKEMKEDVTLLNEEIKPRKNLPPLMVDLKDRAPEILHYLGTSYGITSHLFSFWKKSGYVPVYLRQTPNDLTGEYTCIMLKQLKLDENMEITCSADWLKSFSQDFQKRFINLLSYSFQSLPSSLPLTILNTISSNQLVTSISNDQLSFLFSPFDIKRLDSYSRNLIDYHVILDMMPIVAKLIFQKQIEISLSAGQQSILVGLGLQHKSIDDISSEMTLASNQVLALFNKSIRKVVQSLQKIQEQAVGATLAPASRVTTLSITQSIEGELDEAGDQATQEFNSFQVKSSEKSKLKIVEVKKTPTSGVKRPHPEDGAEKKKKKAKKQKK